LPVNADLPPSSPPPSPHKWLLVVGGGEGGGTPAVPTIRPAEACSLAQLFHTYTLLSPLAQTVACLYYNYRRPAEAPPVYTVQ
jgi:hypothetical protein